MTTSGQPAPGKKIALPSGALWEGGPSAGTSLITLPDGDPILVADQGSGVPNSLVGRSGPFRALAHAFEEVLGHVPSFFTDRVAAQALALLRDVKDPDDVETETRIVKFSAKTTLLNPAKRGNRPGSSTEGMVDEAAGQDDSALDRQNPVRRARGGLVFKPGDTVTGGGTITGPGGSESDLIRLAASPGEFVVNAASTAKTLSLLEAINSGWVPSARFLEGMLPGLAGADPARTTAPDPQQWRDMLGQGVIADALGGMGNAAVDAASWAGAALGSALAPMFGPGGLFAPRPGTGASTAVQNAQGLNDSGSAVPMTASIQATPSTTLGVFGAGKSSGSTAGASGELGSLASALSSGISGAATAAGSRLGEALGSVISPALGPAGELAPKIGEQLGRLIGSRFGGELSTSLTVQAGVGGQTGSVTGTGGGGGGIPSGAVYGDGGGDGSAPEPSNNASGDNRIVDGSGPAGSTGGGSSGAAVDQGFWQYMPGAEDGSLASGWAYVVPENQTRTNAPPDGMAIQNFVRDKGDPKRMVEDSTSRNWVDVLTGKAEAPGAESLAGNAHQYNPSEGNLADLVQLSARKVGEDLGTMLTPILGPDAPQSLSALAKDLMKPIGEAYSAADPNHVWTNALGYKLSELTGIEWSPTGTQGSSSSTSPDAPQQIGFSAFQSGIQGLQQHGAIGGVTGAISGVASTAGGLLGGFIGTAVAPWVGPLGPVVGQFLGSMIGGAIGDELGRPIEWVGSAVKELVGTGFGLTDLAAGPGGHTARGDIYNFNGTDPKRASIAVERVRRRRAVAQQRGGGFGR
ncbi:hypothetical protein ACIP5Y_33085 [Nocardia sp. NPDC088792]|uniref:hypothetical protein n=1 Tax=Nocardia sp. NPDC088792 TaxID=3364332 RepID=UPI0037FB05E6